MSNIHLAPVAHPASNVVVYGQLLKAGETITDGDLYAGSDGQWMPCDRLIGLPIRKGLTTVIVRPYWEISEELLSETTDDQTMHQ